MYCFFENVFCLSTSILQTKEENTLPIIRMNPLHIIVNFPLVSVQHFDKNDKNMNLSYLKYR